MSLKRLLTRWFHRPRMCPPAISVEWANLPLHKQWPMRLVGCWETPRNVAGRRKLSAVLGTTAWMWIDKNRIRAWSPFGAVEPTP